MTAPLTGVCGECGRHQSRHRSRRTVGLIDAFASIISGRAMPLLLFTTCNPTAGRTSNSVDRLARRNPYTNLSRVVGSTSAQRTGCSKYRKHTAPRFSATWSRPRFARLTTGSSGMYSRGRRSPVRTPQLAIEDAPSLDVVVASTTSDPNVLPGGVCGSLDGSTISTARTVSNGAILPISTRSASVPKLRLLALHRTLLLLTDSSCGVGCSCGAPSRRSMCETSMNPAATSCRMIQPAGLPLLKPGKVIPCMGESRAKPAAAKSDVPDERRRSRCQPVNFEG
jgi:hypothetical protein